MLKKIRIRFGSTPAKGAPMISVLTLYHTFDGAFLALLTQFASVLGITVGDGFFEWKVLHKYRIKSTRVRWQVVRGWTHHPNLGVDTNLNLVKDKLFNPELHVPLLFLKPEVNGIVRGELLHCGSKIDETDGCFLLDYPRLNGSGWLKPLYTVFVSLMLSDRLNDWIEGEFV